MYRNILVPIADDVTERTDAAIEIARALAAPEGEITVLHVIETVPGFARTYIPETVFDQAQEDSKTMLSAIAARAPAVSRTAVVHGHGGKTIVQFAEENGTDCIVMGSHRPGFQDVFFGSPAAHVVRHVACAVHVMR